MPLVLMVFIVMFAVEYVAVFAVIIPPVFALRPNCPEACPFTVDP